MLQVIQLSLSACSTVFVICFLKGKKWGSLFICVWSRRGDQTASGHWQHIGKFTQSVRHGDYSFSYSLSFYVFFFFFGLFDFDGVFFQFQLSVKQVGLVKILF